MPWHPPAEHARAALMMHALLNHPCPNGRIELLGQLLHENVRTISGDVSMTSKLIAGVRQKSQAPNKSSLCASVYHRGSVVLRKRPIPPDRVRNATLSLCAQMRIESRIWFNDIFGNTFRCGRRQNGRPSCICWQESMAAASDCSVCAAVKASSAADGAAHPTVWMISGCVQKAAAPARCYERKYYGMSNQEG